MSAGNDRRRPVAGTGAKVVEQQQNDSIVAPHADVPGVTPDQARILHRWIADANGVAPERLALAAVVEMSNGRYRRRVFLTLEAAHRALQRANERGLDARVLLCELRPVGGAA